MADERPIRYAVRILPRALNEIDSAAERFAELAGPSVEAEWREGLRSEIVALAEEPRRHPRIPEQRYFEREVRQLVFRRRLSSAAYRVLFTVDDQGPDGHIVRVFHVRHAAARPLGRKVAREMEAAEE